MWSCSLQLRWPIIPSNTWADSACRPPSCFRSVRQRDTVPAESLPEFLLANCSVLFRACMSAQADTASVIITTCSHAPFRSHHLGDIKQPAQEAVLIAQEARLSGPGFQSIIAACAQIAVASFLLPAPPWTGQEKALAASSHRHQLEFFRPRRSWAYPISFSCHGLGLNFQTNVASFRRQHLNFQNYIDHSILLFVPDAKRFASFFHSINFKRKKDYLRPSFTWCLNNIVASFPTHSNITQ